MIKIKVKKQVNRGQKMLEVIKIDGVMKKDNLPIEYLQDGVCCYYIDEDSCSYIKKYIKAYDEKGKSYSLMEKGWYSEQQFNETLEVIRRAGDRLHEINKKIKQLKEEWNGEIEIII
jgi:hypothetical protein